MNQVAEKCVYLSAWAFVVLMAANESLRQEVLSEAPIVFFAEMGIAGFWVYRTVKEAIHASKAKEGYK